MSAIITDVRPFPGRYEHRSTRIAFFIAGFAVAAWAPLIPFAKERAQLDEAALGVLLLCFGMGSIAGMPTAGALASRLGCRVTATSATLLFCFALPLLAYVDRFSALACVLLLFGLGIGALDVTMNIQAVIVEKASGRSMMSGFHGLYSIGGIAGALSIAGLLLLGISPLAATFCIVAVIIALLGACTRYLLPYGGAGGEPLFALPRGPVLILGALCFIVFLAEGSMLDWSAVFLISVRGVTPEHAGIGYAVFAVAMALGRLSGDYIVEALGGQLIVLFGSLCAAAGFALAASIPSPTAAFIGFAFIGIGCANIVPVFYTEAGGQSVMPANLAISAITTIGYSGILLGPALIGFLAHVTTLGVAFLGIAGLQLAVASCARIAVRRSA